MDEVEVVRDCWRCGGWKLVCDGGDCVVDRCPACQPLDDVHRDCYLDTIGG